MVLWVSLGSQEVLWRHFFSGSGVMLLLVKGVAVTSEEGGGTFEDADPLEPLEQICTRAINWSGKIVDLEWKSPYTSNFRNLLCYNSLLLATSRLNVYVFGVPSPIHDDKIPNLSISDRGVRIHIYQI